MLRTCAIPFARKRFASVGSQKCTCMSASAGMSHFPCPSITRICRLSTSAARLTASMWPSRITTVWSPRMTSRSIGTTLTWVTPTGCCDRTRRSLLGDVFRDDVCAHRERRAADPGDRHRVKAPAGLWHRIKAGHVLAHWDPGAQKLRVRGPREVGGVVDVQRVDADERHLRAREKLRALEGEIRVLGEVRVGPPAARVVSAYQHGATRERAASEVFWADRSSRSGRVDDNHGHVRDALEREVGEVDPGFVAMVWRVDVGSRVAAQVQGRDEELRLAAVALARRRVVDDHVDLRLG